MHHYVQSYDYVIAFGYVYVVSPSLRSQHERTFDIQKKDL